MPSVEVRQIPYVAIAADDLLKATAVAGLGFPDYEAPS